MACYRASYAVGQDNIRVYDFGGIKNGSSYSLEGKLGAKTRQEFDYDQLPLPSTIQPILPKRTRRPDKFICPDGFEDSMISKIVEELDQEDGGIRVPPMALVGCSRAGKTTTLDEIAFRMANNSSNPVNIIYVTFSDYSPLSDEEHTDLLQAFLRRFVFAVTRAQSNETVATYTMEFKAFRGRNEFIDPTRIYEWLKTSMITYRDCHKRRILVTTFESISWLHQVDILSLLCNRLRGFISIAKVLKALV